MPIDMSAATKAPPRKTTSGGGTTARTRATASVPAASSTSVFEARQRGLAGLATLAHTGALMMGWQADAATIAEYGPDIATEIAHTADTNDTIAKGVDWLCQVGPYGKLITLCVPFIMQLAANHKLIPANTPGVKSPEVLASQMNAQLVRMQAEAKREQMQAMREAREAQERFQEELQAYENRQPEPVG